MLVRRITNRGPVLRGILLRWNDWLLLVCALLRHVRLLALLNRLLPLLLNGLLHRLLPLLLLLQGLLGQVLSERPPLGLEWLLRWRHRSLCAIGAEPGIVL